MTYMTREMLKENVKNNSALFDGDKPKIEEAKKFLETEEGHNKELLALINNILNSRNTLYYTKNLKLYIFCLLADWFMINDFLPQMKGGERILIASNLACKVANDLEEKIK